MSNYSDQANSVRVDFFKDTGKWYCTEAVLWRTYKGNSEDGGMLIHSAFAEALRNHLIQPNLRLRLTGMTAVCLEPYFEHAHPIMLPVDKVLGELFYHRAITRANQIIKGLQVDSTIACPRCGHPMTLPIDTVNDTQASCACCGELFGWKRFGTT